MKEDFKHYLELSDSEKQKIWQNGILSFDANILLDLYKFSESAKLDVLKVFKKLNDRLHLSYQVADEFFSLRISNIYKLAKSYDDATSELNSINDKINSKRNHPFIKNELVQAFSILKNEIIQELEANKGKVKEIAQNDKILEQLLKLFDNKIGTEISESEYRDLIKIGNERFQKKIPPGFEDADKSKIKDDKRNYGDLIIWFDLIKKSKKDKKSMIFVTNDLKQDWWLKINNKIIQSRPELLKEFNLKTEQNIIIYNWDDFLYSYNKYIKDEVKTETIDEIKKYKEVIPGYISDIDIDEIEKNYLERKELFEEVSKQENNKNKLDILVQINDKCRNFYYDVVSHESSIAIYHATTNMYGDAYIYSKTKLDKIRAIITKINYLMNEISNTSENLSADLKKNEEK